MISKFLLIILFSISSLSVFCEETYSVYVGVFDINDIETLQFVLDLKKVTPKENILTINSSKFALSNAILVENFQSEKDAISFNEKIKNNFKKFTAISYIVSPELKGKLISEGASPKFNLFVVKSKNDLPKLAIKEMFPNSYLEKSTSKEINLKLQIYEKGSIQEAEAGASMVIKRVSALLADANIFDFTFNMQPFPEIEEGLALIVFNGVGLPIKELKEKYKSTVIDVNTQGNEIWISLTNSDKEISQENIVNISIMIKDISALILQSKRHDFNFMVQKYSKKDLEVVKNEVGQEKLIGKKKLEDEEKAFDEKQIELEDTNLPVTGAGIMGKIGGGGGGGGNFGTRSGGGRKRAVMRGGGSKATESAVDFALNWLAEHQEIDGHWDSGKYEGGGTPEVDCAATASALLSFLGAGHTDRAGKWKINVINAVNWLLASQRPNGSWDTRNYANGICTLAIAEAAGMGCGGSEVKKSAELAVDYLLKQQNASGCFDYTGPSAREDMCVTGWCVMALKSAMMSGINEIEIKRAFNKSGDFLDSIKKSTGDNTLNSKGDSWYTPEGIAGTGTACQAIAMTLRQVFEWEKTAPWMQAAAEGQISKIPMSYAGTDIYRVYYTFLALFQIGGKHWSAWNEPVSKLIVASQRQDGDFKGSWDKNGCHLDKGGRVMYTALLCLSLEVYYRYKIIEK